MLAWEGIFSVKGLVYSHDVPKRQVDMLASRLNIVILARYLTGGCHH